MIGTLEDGTYIHVNVPPLQPATRFRIEIPGFNGEPSTWKWITRPAHARAWCHKCRRRRYLKNMLILEQAWYDPSWFCVECPPRKKRRRR